MFERLKNSALASRIRYAFGKAAGHPGPWDKDDTLVSSTIPVTDDLYSRTRLTPAKLASIIRDADDGEPGDQARLLEVILEKEPRFAAHLQTRRLAVLGCRWSVQSERDPDEAARLEAILKKAGCRKAMEALMRCIGMGYSGVVVDWAPGGGGIRGFRPISSDRWVFDQGGNPALETDTGGRIPLPSLHPAQVLYCQADGMTGLPVRNGLLRTLLWLYLFKNTSFTLWNQFLERFGVPFILGKLPSGDFNDAAKRTELLRSILAVRSGGGGVGTAETDMQMLNGASGGNHDAFERFQRYCDETATLVILGQLASSDRSSGLSMGGAQDKVRQDILEADCELVSQEMQRLLDWLVRFRLGVDGGDFRFVIDCAKPEDMNTRAERDARIAGAAGCFLDRKYAEETYGIRLGERSAVMPGTQEGFSDSPAMPGEQPKRKRPTASDRRMMKICASAIGSLVDADALEAYRGAVERASRNAFGDIPEGLDGHELLEEFKKRAPAFLATLPGAMDGLKEDQLAKALANAMTASAMNSTLPPSFWKTSPLSRAGSRDS